MPHVDVRAWGLILLAGCATHGDPVASAGSATTEQRDSEEAAGLAVSPGADAPAARIAGVADPAQTARASAAPSIALTTSTPDAAPQAAVGSSDDKAGSGTVRPAWATDPGVLAAARALIDRRPELWVADQRRDDLLCVYRVAEKPGATHLQSFGIPMDRPDPRFRGTTLMLYHADIACEDMKQVRAVGEPVILDGVTWFRLEWLE